MSNSNGLSSLFDKVKLALGSIKSNQVWRAFILGLIALLIPLMEHFLGSKIIGDDLYDVLLGIFAYIVAWWEEKPKVEEDPAASSDGKSD